MVQAAPDALDQMQFWEDHLGGNPLSSEHVGWGRERKEEEGEWGKGKRRLERRETEREKGKEGGRKTERGCPGLGKPWLTGLVLCRPHAVDAGARAAVAGVGDKGVRPDGD